MSGKVVEVLFLFLWELDCLSRSLEFCTVAFLADGIVLGVASSICDRCCSGIGLKEAEISRE